MSRLPLIALALAGCSAEAAPSQLQPNPKLDKLATAAAGATQTTRTYIQTDKPLYQPGETIWFRADLRPTKTFVPDGPPTGITMQLLSPRGAVVATKRLLAQAGVGRNDFALPSEIEGGEYTLNLIGDRGEHDTKKVIVNTYEAPRVMKKLDMLRKAYGEGDEVSASLELTATGGAPLANHKYTAVATVDDREIARFDGTTDGAGKATVKTKLPLHIARGDGLLSILVEDGGVTESIQRRIPITLATMQLGVFPEGGDLVTGLASRVYVMAKTPLGKPADIEGRIVDDQGHAAGTFKTVHDGMGYFALTPAQGRTYKVEITKPVGITTVATVPTAKATGCVLHAPSSRIEVTCTTAKLLGVEATLRESRLTGGSFDVKANTPTLIDLPLGAVQGPVRVTIYDGESPIAERLVYQGLGGGLKVSLAPDKKQYAPRDPVAMHVHTTDANGHPVKASVAVAVVDDTVLSFADDKSARILAHMLLEPELGADPIEEPNYYFSDKPDAAAAMDSLLATRGYRRFETRTK